MFNESLTKKDLQYLDMLRSTAKYPEDWIYYGQMVEQLIGDLSSPEEFLKYLRRIEKLYGNDSEE